MRKAAPRKQITGVCSPNRDQNSILLIFLKITTMGITNIVLRIFNNFKLIRCGNLNINLRIAIFLKTKTSELIFRTFCQTPVLGLGLGVDFTFAWDNHNNPHLNFMKGTVPGDKEQGVWIRDKGKGI